ncbi:MAG TPA: protoporphyrinogen oxidase, partial [Longimicrobiales bacterium]|nr:protoporphyrinogen oxidase [Longimicrobiales bacterium]
MRAVFPDLKNGVDDAGSLLRWGLGRRRAKRDTEPRNGEEAPKRPAELFSFPDGLERWPRAIAEILGDDRVRTGYRMVGATREGDEWVVEFDAAGERRTVRCGSLVLAVPAPGVHDALGIDPPSASDAGLGDIPYSPVSTVHTAYRSDSVEHPLDGFGYLCPSSEGRKVLGVLWISSLFPSRVENGRVLLTTFVGGARQPDRASDTEESLIETAYGEHRRFLGATSPPLFAKVQRWPQAIPQYEFGHLHRVAEADRLEARFPGLHLTGAWRDGVSVTDCWKGGRRAARDVLEGQPADSAR